MLYRIDLSFILGIVLVSLLSCGAMALVQQSWLTTLNISPLIVGILLGMTYSLVLGQIHPQKWDSGIFFCGKKLLRLAIILYGFRITFQQILDIGTPGLAISTLMLVTTFTLGNIAGQKLFKLDRDTAILIAAGSAVCGAAAVLAAESVLKAAPHKTIIAIATVVCFGTVSMFLYPSLYQMGVFQLDPTAYGIYAGASIHEVAQVVVAGNAIPGAGGAAVIVKMTRVMMLVPLLFFLNIRYTPLSAEHNNISKPSLIKAIPWFAVLFVLVAGFNSFNLLSATTVQSIIYFDTFMLTMAMTALGMKIRMKDFQQAGLKPLLLAVLLFIWLVVGGYWLTSLLIDLF